ncbi:unnamed protein product, partial [Amoebophrya sp. A25]
RRFCKPYAGSVLSLDDFSEFAHKFRLPTAAKDRERKKAKKTKTRLPEVRLTHIAVRFFPCGGLTRLRVLTRKSELKSEHLRVLAEAD